MGGSFTATLSQRDRRLALRLEGFGDIVFGFAVSQCALQLPVARGHVDLAQVTGLFFYFSTFALLVTLWLTYHRLMSGAYEPGRLDLLIAFSYLALVSLMPYALYSISHDTRSEETARSAVAEYAILFALLMALAALLTLRNLRRGWWSFDEEERDYTWVAFTRRCALCGMMGLGTTVDLLAGPEASGIPFVAIIVVLRLVRSRWKHAPAPAVLRISTKPGNTL